MPIWPGFSADTRTRGHMDGFARGEPGAYAGKPDLNAYYIGGYWTHIRTERLVRGRGASRYALRAKAKSSNDLRTGAKGLGRDRVGGGGLPVPIGEKWHIEPQAQLVIPAP